MLNFKKMYKDFEGRIPCKEGCSTCCQRAGDIVLLPKEFKLLIEKVPAARKYIYTKKVNGQVIELIKQPCPFLKNGLCSIEENKPFDCRSYPLDYCLYKNKIIIITSKSCPILKKMSKNEMDNLSKLMLYTLNKLPKEWIKSAVYLGPCGNCNKENCILRLKKGINDQEW